MTNNTTTPENSAEEEVKNAVRQFFRFISPLCPHCAHEKVCKLKESVDRTCSEFLSNQNYKCYGNIHDLFQPIFDWMEYHYPSGEARFIVDKKSAVMHLEHGVSAYSKKVTAILPNSFQNQQQERNGDDAGT